MPALTMNRPDTLQNLVRTLSVHGNRPAVLTFHKHTVDTISFGELAEALAGLAAGLLHAGLQQGEHIALYSSNRPEWIIACLAVIEAGAIPVPIDSQVAGDDLAHIIQDCGARWIMTTRSLADRLATFDLHRERVIVLLDEDKDDPRSWQRVRSRPAPAPSVARDGCALLFYTSGVSGRPKGVPLSHCNLISNLEALIDIRVYRSDERLLLPLPLHHVYPFMVGLLAPFTLGLPIVLPHSLTGPQILRALQEGQVTAIVGVPRLYAALSDAIEQRVRREGRAVSAIFHAMLACSSLVARYGTVQLGRYFFSSVRSQVAPQLRTLVYGGSALAPDLAWRLQGLGWQIAGGFGLTETSPILTFIAPGSRHIDSAGKPLSGVHLRIADADPETHQGEIQAKGLNIFSGYLHLPDKTHEAFTQDGWFRTGDLGFFDQHGFLHLVGRASSRITMPGGEKIWPERVEEVLDGASTIRESGVLARDGRLVAVIVPRAASGPPADRETLTRSIRADIDARLSLLPSYARPTDFVLSMDPLPRTRLGKIQRHKLNDLFVASKQRTAVVEPRPIPIEQMVPEDRQLLEDPIALQTWHWLITRFPAVRLTPDTNLSLELGIDSLEWMAMSFDLHDRVGVELPEDAIARVGTVRDLLREAMEAEETAGSMVDPAVQLTEPDRLLDPQQRRWLTERGPLLRGLGAALLALDRLLMRIVFPLEVQGLDHIPRNGPCILVCNHVSLLDPLALIAALPPGFLHRSDWGGWTGIMFRNPVMRLISRATRVLPIDQSSRPLANLALGAAALRSGNNLIWFPEGNRSPDGRLQPFQPGIGLIVTAHPVPVIPVRIEGTFNALPRGARWPRRGQIRILFGKSLTPEELGGQRTGPDRYRYIAAELHDHVAMLAGRLR